MTLKIEEGKFYRDINGTKHGPMEYYGGTDSYGWSYPGVDFMWWSETGEGQNDDIFHALDLVAEWQDEPTGPVRTVTRREIVPGVYGPVKVEEDKPGMVSIILRRSTGKFSLEGLVSMTAEDLRSAAMVLSQLAEALDDNKDAGK